jgi:putative transposase
MRFAALHFAAQPLWECGSLLPLSSSFLEGAPMPDWPHAPVHRLDQPGAYMVTAGTYLKHPLLNTPGKLTLVKDELFDLAEKYEWKLQAWAILSNHYHFIAISAKGPETLTNLIQEMHSLTARRLNELDQAPGRQVWFQYWDRHLTFPKSYFARLNYVHRNPVKHGVVTVAENYAWGSAGWFQRTAYPSFAKRIGSFKTDMLEVPDDF